MSPPDLFLHCTVFASPSCLRKFGHTGEATPSGGPVSLSCMFFLSQARVLCRAPPSGGREWSSHESLFVLPLSCRFVVCFKSTMCSPLAAACARRTGRGEFGRYLSISHDYTGSVRLEVRRHWLRPGEFAPTFCAPEHSLRESNKSLDCYESSAPGLLWGIPVGENQRGMWSPHYSASASDLDGDRRAPALSRLECSLMDTGCAAQCTETLLSTSLPAASAALDAPSSRGPLGVMRKCGAGSTAGAQSTRLLVSFVCGDVGSERMTGTGWSPDTCHRTLCGSGDFPLLFRAWFRPRRRAEDWALVLPAGKQGDYVFLFGVLSSSPLGFGRGPGCGGNS